MPSALAFTWALVAASPPRMTSSASRPQAVIGSRSRMAVTSSRGAPASRQAPRAMSPAMPAKQWNQATVVIGRRPPPGVPVQRQVLRRNAGSWAVPGPGPFQGAEDAGGGAGGAVAVVDAHHRHAGGAAGQHGQEGGDALQRGAVAGAGRHRD